jgi:hypothetical protein
MKSVLLIVGVAGLLAGADTTFLLETQSLTPYTRTYLGNRLIQLGSGGFESHRPGRGGLHGRDSLARRRTNGGRGCQTGTRDGTAHSRRHTADIAG